MKTAVLFFGHIRTFAKTKEKYLKLFETVAPDIFVHTWDTYGYSTNGDDSRCHTAGLYSDKFNIEPRWDSGIINFNLLSDLNIKACVVENKNEVMPEIYERSLKYKDCRSCEVDHPGNIISCNRKIYLVNQLYKNYCIQNSTNYDKVILLRFDLDFDVNIFTGTDLSVINVYNGPYGIAAHMSVCGTPEQVTEYANIYNNFDLLVENGTKFNPHHLDEAYFRLFNIKHTTYDRLSIIR